VGECLYGGVIALAIIGGGCSDPDLDFGEGDIALRSSQENGFNLNGFNLNGFNLNGFNLNGFNLNGVIFGLDGDLEGSIELLKVKLPGGELADSVWVEAGQLHVATGEQVLSGADVKGVKLIFKVAEAEQGERRKKIKISGVDVNPETGMFTYETKLKIEQGVWDPLCVDQEGNAHNAIILDEIWDPATGARTEVGGGAVTFACQGAALAKCADWGYLPWADLEGLSLKDMHQACTRMVRADYCGDGSAHTVDGTLIHVLDELGIQEDDDGLDYGIEAEWGPDGATCLNVENTRLDGVEIGCSIPACGDSFASGGMLQSGKVFGEL